MYFDIKAIGNRITRDKSVIRFLQSTALMASGVFTIFTPQKPNEVCDRVK